GGRKINRHGFRSDVLATNKIQQASVAGAQVKGSTSRRRNELEQRRLAFLAMGNRVGTFEIVAGVLVRGPEIDGLGVMRRKTRHPNIDRLLAAFFRDDAKRPQRSQLSQTHGSVQPANPLPEGFPCAAISSPCCSQPSPCRLPHT